MLFVDFALGSLNHAPKAVVHHLYGQGAVNPGSSSPAPIDYLAAPFDISAGTPRVIGPPVKGDHWIALNGCCLPGFPHRSSMASLNGQLINAQRFAIDWKRTDDKGAFYEGDRTKNESYVDYGEPIYAVADGTITATLDELEANAPGVLPANDRSSPKITVQTVDGNHIVEDIGGGVWAFYAHLQKDTLLVKPGDKVKKGQVIAKLGDTGNSNASHMHFQLMNGPSVLGSDGVPYVIDRFSYDGQVPVETIFAADDFLSGDFLTGALPRPQPRKQELPSRWPSSTSRPAPTDHRAHRSRRPSPCPAPDPRRRHRGRAAPAPGRTRARSGGTMGGIADVTDPGWQTTAGPSVLVGAPHRRDNRRWR